jgi:molecular chaperone DnaK
MSDLRTALKGEDRGAIDKKAEQLAQASASVAQRAQQAEQGAGPGPEASGEGASAQSGGGAKRDDVVDAEFEEVKDPNRKAS